MTNFKTEIEEIEKRFDENPMVGGGFKDLEILLRRITTDKQAKETTAEHVKAIKAFYRAELSSLLSKFAAAINGEEFIPKSGEAYCVHEKKSWNAHHRSVAEKASQIIKSLKT